MRRATLVPVFGTLMTFGAGPSVLQGADSPALPPAANRKVDFSRDVQPLLEQKCHVCHGAAQQMNGLRLDRPDAALQGGYSGPAILPGNSSRSRLIHLVAGAVEDKVMPPVGKRLSAAEIGILRAWIDQGADWPSEQTNENLDSEGENHWAFQPIRQPLEPVVRNQTWAKNPIDSFVLARLEAEGIGPSREADKNTLVRRLYLDLIGLPPSPEQVAAFVSDKRPEAYDELVEHLLASRHYGEKWARPWLDLARYADSDGYSIDWSRPHAWRWRHWVIEALNRDMPFDRFTTEQIAGDLLPNATVDQHVATGFHRNTLWSTEGGVDPDQLRDDAAADRTNTVGMAWLGLTVGCARCHDHKYDPISQKEYYQLFAFFDTTHDVQIDAPLPGEAGPYARVRPKYEKRRRELLRDHCVAELQQEWEEMLLRAIENPGEGEGLEADLIVTVIGVVLEPGIRIIKTPPAQRTKREQEALTNYFIWRLGGEVPMAANLFSEDRLCECGFPELPDRLKELDAMLPPFAQARTIVEAADPKPTHIHIRGDFRRKGIQVQPGTPGFLPALNANGKQTRFDLARWLVDRENPLTARVTMNRMWQEYFGRGLVRTSEDFGTQGEQPSHPGLLDWLAAEFMDRGWSLKQMHRLIVSSATYRQASEARPELAEIDPDNTLLARQSRVRLPAELIRDLALEAAGLLTKTIGGRSVRPPQPEGVPEPRADDPEGWEESQGPDRYRRGLYIKFRRKAPYPMLANFDAPDSYAACSRRGRSNTPLQALNLLNDPVFMEAARGLASRVLNDESSRSRPQRIERAFLIALARKPTKQEADEFADVFKEQTAVLERDPESAAKLSPKLPPGTDAVQAAAWLGISRILLNLDEFITRE